MRFAGLLLFSVAIGSSAVAQWDSGPVPSRPAFDPSAMDASVDPCVDFYRYACGGWHASSPRPTDESFWSLPFTEFARDLERWISDLVERTASESLAPPSSEQRVSDYWTACMAAEGSGVDATALDALHLDLAQVAGLNSLDGLPALLGRLLDDLPYVPWVEPLFYLSATESPWAGRAEVGLRVGPNGLGLPSVDLYLGEDEQTRQRLAGYRELIEQTMASVGPLGRTVAQRASEIVAFETAIALLRRPPGSGGVVDESRTVFEWSALEEMTGWDWDPVLKLHGIGTVDRVWVREPDFFRSLGPLLEDTPIATLRAYLGWMVTLNRSESLGGEIAERRFEFFGRDILGLADAPPRERVCMEALERDLPFDIGRVFARHAFDSSTGELARELFVEVRGVLRQRIGGLDGLSAATRRAAIEKIERVELQLGVPDQWLVDERLVMRPDDFDGNVRRAGASLRRIAFARLGRPSDTNWWDMPATWVGGYYSRQSNRIVITAAGLRIVEATRDDPGGLYGGLGLFLAHELLHALDPGGSAYDAEGRWRNWWSPSDAEWFRERSSCLAEHFSTYEYAPGIPVDGAYVLDEQVAELGAWPIAWAAYQRVSERSGRSSDREAQAFFVAGAQSWCAQATDAEWRVRASGGSFKAWAAPMVHGTVRQLPEFGTVFGCEVSDPMILPAAEQCRVW